jgi:exosome complex RNA-binding protein Rrp4
MYTIPAVSGCDTVVTVNVTVDPYETNSVNGSFCPGDSVQVYGQWYNTAGTFMDTIPAVSGCDTVVVINITADPYETNTIDVSHCPNDSVQVGGIWYTGPGTFMDTIAAVSGCDTVVTINVTVDPYETSSVNASFCPGDSVQVHGQWYNTAGTFMDTIPAVSGCDTVVTIDITADPYETNTIDVSHCPNDSVQVGGIWYTGPGTFMDTIAAVSGCDTIVTINVTVDPFETNTVDASYCPGDSVLVYGMWYSTPGTFMDTIPAISGCDTVVTISISESLLEQVVIDVSHCPNDSVQVNGTCLQVRVHSWIPFLQQVDVILR